VSDEQSRLSTNPPDDFIEQVKDALEHLYDFPHLQNHPLIDKSNLPEQSPESPVQQLRRELLELIETLNPGENVPFRSPHARLYNILHLHYVEGMTVQETAKELGISLRQAYRDLRKG
jgi:DNA-directed RNA polymerase specialized sigma24 family protein